MIGPPAEDRDHHLAASEDALSEHVADATVVVFGGSHPVAAELAAAALARGAREVVLADREAPDLRLLDPKSREITRSVVVAPDDDAATAALLEDVRPAVVLDVSERSLRDDGTDDRAWVAVLAASVGCRSYLRVRDLAGGPARHDPTASDASLRAALDNERANADHLRRLSRDQASKLRRPLVRVALTVDKRLVRTADLVGVRRRRLIRRVARLGLLGAAGPTRTTLDERRQHVEQTMRALPPAPALDRSVSVVVVTDTPLELDSTLLTDPPVEIIGVLVGNRARISPEPDVTLTRPAETTMVAAAAAGAGRAHGDLLCFLAPTTAGLDDHWLARLAATIEGSTIAAVPMLLHPQRRVRDATPHDLLVRSAGLDIVVNDAGAPEVRALEAGSELVADRPPAPVAAGGSACLLVDRWAYIDAGGLAGNPDSDAAFVDLCARLRVGGAQVAVVPRAVMVDHRPVASVRALTRPIDHGAAGWASVVDRMGPALRQLARGDDVTEHLRIAITIAAPTMRAATQWGDFHLAQALARSLRRLGHSVHLQTLDQVDDPTGRSCDVHVVLRGLAPVARTPGQVHVLWVISHPEAVDLNECDDADLVLVASERFATALRERTSTPVEVMLQATDPRRFRPLEPDPAHGHAVAVVATTRHIFRPSVADALEVGLRPAVYGTGWEEFIDPDLIVAEFVPNDQLAQVYSSVGVLLNDHWDTMRAWGFVSNRLFDALACGTPVVSDHLPEIGELFDGSVATYRDAPELLERVEAALSDPIAARRRAAEGRTLVLEHHTFDHRAKELLDALARHGLVQRLR